jgi:Na+-transporting methylmalonyl-CoA/oxaloacetate decarboxylase gamma subunit
MLAQGLTISLLGIGVTFAALVLLIGVILLLQAVFPVKEGPASEVKSVEEARRKAAAVAVAVSLMAPQAGCDPNLGSLLEKPRGPWWQGGGFMKAEKLHD